MTGKLGVSAAWVVETMESGERRGQRDEGMKRAKGMGWRRDNGKPNNKNVVRPSERAYESRG